MAPYPKNPPLADYICKLLLLEAVKCQAERDVSGLQWVERLMFFIVHRWKELDKK